MTVSQFALFDTGIGRCGIVWGRNGVTSVQLPEATEAKTRARLLERFPGALEAPPQPAVKRAMGGIVALLRGEPSDLDAVPLDMEGVPPFHRRVYEAARAIPPGATLSYGELATNLGAPGSARAVGQALGRNPFALVVPCHRVLAAGGKTGGFTANGGVTTKLQLLALEGHVASPVAEPAHADCGFGFDPDVAVRHLRESDAALAKIIDAVGPFRMELKTTPSLFVALAEAIVHQQLNGKAAATIFGRVCALFPRAAGGPAPKHILGASDEALRGAGLSRSKLLALRDLAARSKAGTVPTLSEARSMDNDAIIEQLTEVRGIGRWTVEMLLMFRLGRPDVLPVDDYGIRQGFAVAFKKQEFPGRKDLEKRGARWKPYRTVASWYLWRAVELGRK